MQTRDSNEHLIGISLEEAGIDQPLSTEAMRAVDELCRKLNEGTLPEVIKANEDDMDTLARHAYIGCMQGGITTEQLSTILEIRSIYAVPGFERELLRFLPLTADSIESQFDELAFDDLAKLHPDDPGLPTMLLNELEKKPASEHYFLKFAINIDELPKDERFKAFISLLIQSRATTVKNVNNFYYEFGWPLAGARDAITRAHYGRQAKRVFPYLGAKIKREEISKGMSESKRYMSVSFPETEDPESFHELSAPLIFHTMHDEVHRQWISSIPNPVYDAILRAIKITREACKRPWSKELWSMTDMDFDLKLLDFTGPSEELSSTEITYKFVDLLSAHNLEGDHVAFLMPTPYCDTTWMFLIDLFKNEEQWNKLQIKAEALPPPYNEMFNHLAKHRDVLINTENAAEQILKLKCGFLNIDYPKNKEIRFSRRLKSRGTYIQVMVDGKPYPLNKYDFTLLDNDRLSSLHQNRKILDTFMTITQSEKLYPTQKKIALTNLAHSSMLLDDNLLFKYFELNPMGQTLAKLSAITSFRGFLKSSDKTKQMKRDIFTDKDSYEFKLWKKPPLENTPPSSPRKDSEEKPSSNEDAEEEKPSPKKPGSKDSL